MKKYKIDERATVILTDRVMDKLNKYRQLEGMSEAGGILLGKIKTDYSEYIIEDISEPSKMDKRSRFSFVRNRKSAQRIINKSFKESNGIIQYLGEWHTHPQINPFPSPIDKNLLIQCSKNIENVSCTIFMIILGFDGSLFVGYTRKNNNELIDISTF